MKKWALCVMALLVALASAQSVYADDALDANTSDEIRIMHTPPGAQIRVLQLEKHLTRNVLVGAKVIEAIKASGADANTAEAEATLDQLEALVAEIRGLGLSGDANSLARQFVEMKKEGIDLTRLFREQTRGLITEENKAAVREAVKGIDRNELKAINGDIAERIREFNAARVAEALSAMGLRDEEFLGKIKSGEITPKQLMESMKAKYVGLAKENRLLAGQKMKEMAIKRQVAARAIAEKAKERLGERMMERAGKRALHAMQWKESMGMAGAASAYHARAKRLVRTTEELEKMPGKPMAAIKDRATQGRGAG